MIKLLIIILNYRTPGLTVDCLMSLSGQMREGYFAVVIDNASGDESEQAIGAAITENGWDKWCSLHVMPRNGGFSWGNNQGLKLGPESEFILLLNSDTIVKPGCLNYCVEAMEADTTIGALSCQVLNSDGTIQTVSRRIPNPVNLLVSATGLPWKLPKLFGWANINAPEWDRRKAMNVGWIIGAFLMTRRKLVDRIGPLDESFFFYGEDVEFCHRVWKSGHRVRFDPGAEIIHFGGGSSGEETSPDLNRVVRMLTAKYLIQKRMHGDWAAHLVMIDDWVMTYIRLFVARFKKNLAGDIKESIEKRLKIIREAYVAALNA